MHSSASSAPFSTFGAGPPAAPPYPPAAPVFAVPAQVFPAQAQAPAQPTMVASLRRRAAAYLIDATIAVAIQIVLYVIALIIIFAAAASSAAAHPEGGGPDELVLLGSVFSVVLLIDALVAFLFLIWIPTRGGTWNGRTVGKRAMGIRVVRLDGQPLRPGRASLRTAGLIGAVWVAWLFGALLDAVVGTGMLFTFAAFIVVALYELADLVVAPMRGSLRRTMHDHAAGTVVIESRVTPTYPGYAPVPPPSGGTLAGRPKTPGTYVMTSICGLILVAMAALYLFLVATGDTSSSWTVPTGGDDDSGALVTRAAAPSAPPVRFTTDS